VDVCDILDALFGKMRQTFSIFCENGWEYSKYFCTEIKIIKMLRKCGENGEFAKSNGENVE